VADIKPGWRLALVGSKAMLGDNRGVLDGGRVDQERYIAG
jgi:hypothetical protein